MWMMHQSVNLSREFWMSSNDYQGLSAQSRAIASGLQFASVMYRGHAPFFRGWAPSAVVIALLFLVVSLASCGTALPTPPDVLTITINQNVFSLELALDDTSRRTGLSGRAHIDPYGGMLFVFDQPQSVPGNGFYMRGCLVPIDLIFLDPGGRIIAIHQMDLEPDVPDNQLRIYQSPWPYQYAIELAAGMADQLQLQPNQLIKLPIADLKGWAR